MTSLIRAENISKSFGKRPILSEINIGVEPEEIVTLIGPNGAGKSTLLRIMLGLMTPDIGQIYQAPQLKIGYMPQKIQIEPFLPLSVKRFLQLAGRHPINTPAFSALLKEVRIEHLLEQPIQSISGGELQRVLLARALLRSPDLLVLDEPAQGIDVAGQEELYHLITQIRNRLHCGILMVSHDLHLVMADTDSVICLNTHICCSGRPEDVSRHPAYLNLFGLSPPKGIAVYAHNHNHKHDINGKICN